MSLTNYIYVYIYIYIEREREREKQTDRLTDKILRLKKRLLFEEQLKSAF